MLPKDRVDTVCANDATRIEAFTVLEGKTVVRVPNWRLHLFNSDDTGVVTQLVGDLGSEVLLQSSALHNHALFSMSAPQRGRELSRFKQPRAQVHRVPKSRRRGGLFQHSGANGMPAELSSDSEPNETAPDDHNREVRRHHVSFFFYSQEGGKTLVRVDGNGRHGVGARQDELTRKEGGRYTSQNQPRDHLEEIERRPIKHQHTKHRDEGAEKAGRGRMVLRHGQLDLQLLYLHVVHEPAGMPLKYKERESTREAKKTQGRRQSKAKRVDTTTGACFSSCRNTCWISGLGSNR